MYILISFTRIFYYALERIASFKNLQGKLITKDEYERSLNKVIMDKLNFAGVKG